MVERHLITRRRALALGGATFAGIAGGAVWLGGRSNNAKSNEPAPTLVSSSDPSPSASGAGPWAMLPDGFDVVDDAFETRQFAPNEQIDWTEGLFFLRPSGEIDAVRVAESLLAKWPEDPDRPSQGWISQPEPEFIPLARYTSMVNGEFVHARLSEPRGERALLYHRASGVTLTWDTLAVMVWGVGPYLMLVRMTGVDLRYGQSMEFETLDYELLDGDLALVRKGTIAAHGNVFSDWTEGVAYDWSTDTLYTFVPDVDDIQKLVSVVARSNEQPRDVPLLPEMESITLRARGATGEIATLDDRKTFAVQAESNARHWRLHSNGAFVPLELPRFSTPDAAVSPSGKYLASASTLPNSSSPGNFEWPCVVISDALTGAPLWRIRSAERRPWTLDDQLSIRYADNRAGLVDFSSGTPELRQFPAFYDRHARAVPSPFDAGHVAVQPPGIYFRGTSTTTSAAVRADADWYGEPWSGRADEMVFGLQPANPPGLDTGTTEYGEHMLQATFEQAPFSDALEFTAANTFDPRDAPMFQGSPVFLAAEGERLTLTKNLREEYWGYTTAIWQGGDLNLVWAHVANSVGEGGWIPLFHLRWAIGTPLVSTTFA